LTTGGVTEGCIASSFGGTCWPGEQPWASGHPASGDAATGFWVTDDPLLCQPYGVAPPNAAGATCPFNELYFSLHGAQSGADPQYVMFSNTRNQDNTTPLSTGTWLGPAALYTGVWNPAATYTSKADVVYYNSAAPSGPLSPGEALVFYSPTSVPVTGGTAPGQSGSTWAVMAGYGYGNYWDIPSLTIRQCVQFQCSGHSDQGFTSTWSGSYGAQHLRSQPSTYLCKAVSGSTTGYATGTVYVPYVAATPATFMATGCATSSATGSPGDIAMDETNPYPMVETAPNTFPSDTHESVNGIQTLADRGILLYFVDDVPITPDGSNSSSPYGTLSAYNQEIVGAATGIGTGGTPVGTDYRIAHHFNFGDSPLFDTQNGIGVESQDAQLAIVPSDMFGTRGSTSPGWPGGAQVVVWGAYIYPPTGHNNTLGYEYQATAISGNANPAPGTSGATNSSSEPVWDTACVTTCTDGTITWQRMKGNCNQLRAYTNEVTRGSTPPALTDLVCIFPNAEGGNTHIFCASSGTPASTAPAFKNMCTYYGPCVNGSGTAILDGTVQWFDEGASDCRSDIMLVDLVSARPAQHITFTTNAPSTAENTSNFTVAAAALSGGTVTFSTDTPAVCSVSGATYTMLASSGTCDVIANQTGNSAWRAAPAVVETVSALPFHL
jgi:hypothetical protein